jgi:hypothetical protein
LTPQERGLLIVGVTKHAMAVEQQRSLCNLKLATPQFRRKNKDKLN